MQDAVRSLDPCSDARVCWDFLGLGSRPTLRSGPRLGVSCMTQNGAPTQRPGSFSELYVRK